MKNKNKLFNAFAKFAMDNGNVNHAFFVLNRTIEFYGKNVQSGFTPLPNKVKALLRQLKK